MEKNTKGKLLAIGVLVLLLVSMIPMAATAAPKPKTVIRDTVYYGIFPTSSPLGSEVGKITIDLATFDYSCNIRKVSTDTTYMIWVHNRNDLNIEGVPLLEQNLISDSRGSIKSKGTITNDAKEEIELLEGNVVFVLGNAILPPG